MPMAAPAQNLDVASGNTKYLDGLRVSSEMGALNLCW